MLRVRTTKLPVEIDCHVKCLGRHIMGLKTKILASRSLIELAKLFDETIYKSPYAYYLGSLINHIILD